MMQVVGFCLDDAGARRQYDELFAACPQAFIQQSTKWAQIIRSLGTDEPYFLMAVEAGRLIGGLPLYLFKAPPGAILTSVPHAGPLGGVFHCADIAAEPIYAALLAEADKLATARQCLAMTLITSPFADDLPLYEKHLRPSIVFENFTQAVPIADAVRDGRFILRNNKKANPGATIRKAEAAGFSTRLCTERADFQSWYSIHVKRSAEIGTAPLKRALVEGIWENLASDGSSFLQLVLDGDRIAAGCLFILNRDVCDVFAVSMDSAYAAQSPNYLAIRDALIEMWRRGVKLMNWQSSPRRRDGVYKFKRQWGSVERPYFFVTKTYGKPDVILKLGPERARREYADHFLVPFGVFESRSLTGRYAKG
jgi:hypothetical protein